MNWFSLPIGMYLKAENHVKNLYEELTSIRPSNEKAGKILRQLDVDYGIRAMNNPEDDDLQSTLVEVILDNLKQK